MTEDNILELQEVIDNEGFDYAMTYYSDWKEIDDPTFQEYLKDFINSRDVLQSYLSMKRITI